MQGFFSHSRMQTRTDIDLLIEASWVIPVEPDRTVLHDHAIAVRDGRIVAIEPIESAREDYRASETVALDGHAVIPGLVNLHTHAAMTLLRGIADDLSLMDWLSNHIWPAEGKHVSAQFVHDGTLLACAEMLKSGVTCFNDMYFFPEMAGRAALEAGMRATLGIVLIEFPTPYASDPQDYLRKGLAARDELKDEALLSFCMAPHAPYTVSDKSFEQVATLSDQLQLPVHVHLHETRGEIEESLRQHGVRPLRRLQRLGLLGPGLIAVHAVHLEEHEIAELASQGCSSAHCPASNLKLASGIAPVGRMLARGMNVGIGTDGAASNNRLDVLSELRLAALVAKAADNDAETLPSHTAPAMATLSGARALGLDGDIGSIVPGKLADLTAVNLSAIELSPCYDPASHLIYAAGREHVTDVWVQGKRVVRDGKLCRLDEKEVRANAIGWQSRISTAS
jgi:5-methylthioadenosine/S-adenosylhomocysteine deaminase